ncbi:integral membrane protein [Xylariaceae sp. FL1272]|nr:integral membrane protein [Xylariaceae sp. FL1272]
MESPGPDVDRGPTLIGVFAAEAAVSLVFLSLRVWARFSISAVGWDDVFMIITWVLFAVLTSFVGVFAGSGGIRHLYYLPKEQAIYTTRLNWIGQPFGIIAVATGKVSVGLLLLRFIPPAAKWRRRFIWVAMGLTLITNSLAVVFTYAQCKNPAALWDPDVRGTTPCWDPKIQSDFSIFTGSFNSFVDFVFALLPITIVWKLHMSTRKRLGLAALLGGGSLSGISAAIKTSELRSLTVRTDETWATFSLYLWTGIEIFVIIVCGCICTLKPLWIRVFGKKSTGSYGYSNDSSFGYRFQKNQPPDQDKDFIRLDDMPTHVAAVSANGNMPMFFTVGQDMQDMRGASNIGHAI